MSDEDLLQIVDLQIAKLNKIVESRDLKIVLTDDARKWLIEKTCADRKYGARPLKRALQKYVEDELSEALIQGERYRRKHRRGIRRRRQTRIPRDPRQKNLKKNLRKRPKGSGE